MVRIHLPPAESHVRTRLLMRHFGPCAGPSDVEPLIGSGPAANSPPFCPGWHDDRPRPPYLTRTPQLNSAAPPPPARPRRWRAAAVWRNRPLRLCRRKRSALRASRGLGGDTSSATEVCCVS